MDTFRKRFATRCTGLMFTGSMALLALLLSSGGATADAQQSGSPPETPLHRLQSAIERITRSVNATWGIYIKSLETGEEIAIDADRQMETMSTIKIALMVEALEQVKAGRFKLSDTYTLAAADIRPGTGIIQR